MSERGMYVSLELATTTTATTAAAAAAAAAVRMCIFFVGIETTIAIGL